MSEHTPAPSHGPEHGGASGKLGKLGTKVGGLPVWAWGTAVLGGLVIAWYIRGRSSSAAPTDPTTADVLTAESPGTGGAGYSSGGYSLPTTTPTDTSGGGSGGGSSSSTDPTGATDPLAPLDPTYDYTDGYDTADPVALSDNDWRVAMIRAMVAAGHSPITAEQALSNYLGGKPLTQAQAQVLNQAMTATGPRPDAAPTPSVIPQAKPKPKPAPVHTPTHTKAPAPKHKPAHHPTHHTAPAAHHPAHHPISTRDTGKAPHHPAHHPEHKPAPHHPAPHHKPKKGHK